MNSSHGLPVLDFTTFLFSLSRSALLHMGEVPHPETEAVETNLPLARQTIDLLGLLEEKTRGNLSGDEERFLSEILADLRLRFVALTHKETKEKEGAQDASAS